MRTSNLRAIALPLCVLLSSLSPFIAQSPAQTVATWTGDAGNSDYYDAANWDIGVIPINDGTTTYAVVIPDGTTVSLSTDGSFEITDLSLGSNGILNVGSNSTLTVLDEAEVAGRITASNGHFVAATPGAVQITGNASTFSVDDSGTLSLAAQSYSSTGLYSTYSSSNYHQSRTHTLFSATGAGSVLDLSTIQSINAGFYDGDRDQNIHQIVATNEGRIDLSSVQTITAPRLYDSADSDRLDIIVNTNAEIDLSGLQTLTSAGIGYTRFDIDVPLFQLNALETADRVSFEVGPGTIFEMNSLLTASRTNVYLSEESTLTLPSMTSHNSGTYSLPAGASVTAGESMSCLKSVSLSLSDTSSFVAPGLTDFSGSSVTLTSSRVFDTGGLTNLDNAKIAVEEGAVWGTVTGDVAAEAYSSTGLYSTYSSSNYHQSRTHTLFSATGAGSVLDLSTIQSINAGFYDGDRDQNIHQIVATNEGRIDLSSVQTITAPRLYDSADSDRLDIIVNTNAEIDLSGLQTLTSAGTGRTRLSMSTGGRILFGSLAQVDRADFYVNDIDSTMRIDGNFDLGTTSTLNVATLASVEITGSFVFGSTSESTVGLDDAILRMNGDGGQFLEVGGEDLGVEGASSGNFGIGQLVIGRTQQRTSVELIDGYDNGNRGATGREVLYLYGQGGPDGLRILNDSALVLNGLDVYTWDAATSEMIHLNSLFGEGDLRIEYDDGYIQLVPLDFQWDNIGGGDFAVPGNWSDDLLPLASDSAIWNLGSFAGYTVQFGSNVATDAAIVKNDTVTFDLHGYQYTGAALHATAGLVVGQSEFDNASLTLRNGTFAGRNAWIGAASGGSGTLTVEADARVILDEELVFGEGNSTLNLGAGGTVAVGTGSDEVPAGTLQVYADGLLAGTGTVIGDVQNDGLVRPGLSAGIITVDGDYAQTENGLLELELAATTPGESHDQLAVSGEAILDGLVEILLEDECVPALEDTFTVLTFGSVDGNFARYEGLILADGLALRPIFESDRLDLTVKLAGDVNDDGYVGSQDLDTVRANWNQAVPAGDWSFGDISGDGVVGSADLDLIRANWGVSAETASAVPEPGVVLLTTAGLLSLLVRRRRN